MVDYVKDLHQLIIQVVQHHQQVQYIRGMRTAQLQQTTLMMLGQETQELLLDLLMQLELEQQH